ncbi:MAG: hypothetical protein WBW88_14850 [Rhodothermales bacterium]
MAERRGMFIKNVSDHSVDIRMKTRTLKLSPGDIQIITAEEVRDAVLREHLQVRSVAIVRPATAEEEEAFVNDTASGS